MPLFEYRCNDCKEKFEVFTLSTRKKPASTCTSCGSERTHKIISPSGIIFKGSGFYVNDSKKCSSNSSEKTNSTDNNKKDDKIKA